MYVQLKLRIRSAGDRLQGDDQIPPELLSRLDQVSHTPVPVTAAFLRRCVVIRVSALQEDIANVPGEVEFARTTNFFS